MSEHRQPQLMAAGYQSKCFHDWVLTYRDGPNDANDWKCTKCGSLSTTYGPPQWRRPPATEE